MQKDTILSQINNLHDKKSLLIKEKILNITDIPTNILFCGETGSGKDIMVQYLHQMSSCSEFLELHCGNTPEDLVESEWFGYKKGSFTGALQDKMGKLSQITNGIIYFNQIDLLSINIQKKLLRVIERRKFFPLGSSQELSLKARLIFSTDSDLDSKIDSGAFRRDLYYRISSLRIDIPPLRDRQKDILPILEYYANKNSLKIQLTKKGLKFLQEYSWFGNIREIENFISNIAIQKKILEDPDVFNLHQDSQSFFPHYKDSDISLESMEMKYINYLLSKYQNKAKVARILKISRKTLYNKLSEYDRD